VDDAAEARLEGDVAPRSSGGVIRYRIWPARRHPVRLTIVLALVTAATIGAATAFEAFYWPAVVALGLTAAAAPFFFPTEVCLDGPQLNMKSLGTPRVWDLRLLRRIEVSDDVLHRVELLPRARSSPMDRVKGVTVPMPGDRETADKVLVHLRRWVGRRETGRFSLDADHAPEDSLDPEV